MCNGGALLFPGSYRQAIITLSLICCPGWGSEAQFSLCGCHLYRQAARARTLMEACAGPALRVTKQHLSRSLLIAHLITGTLPGKEAGGRTPYTHAEVLRVLTKGGRSSRTRQLFIFYNAHKERAPVPRRARWGENCPAHPALQ